MGAVMSIIERLYDDGWALASQQVSHDFSQNMTISTVKKEHTFIRLDGRIAIPAEAKYIMQKVCTQIDNNKPWRGNGVFPVLRVSTYGTSDEFEKLLPHLYDSLVEEYRHPSVYLMPSLALKAIEDKYRLPALFMESALRNPLKSNELVYVFLRINGFDKRASLELVRKRGTQGHVIVHWSYMLHPSSAGKEVRSEVMRDSFVINSTPIYKDKDLEELYADKGIIGLEKLVAERQRIT